MSDKYALRSAIPAMSWAGTQRKDQASVTSTEASHQWRASQEAQSANQRRGNSFARFQIKSSCQERSPAAKIGHSSVALDAASCRWGMPGVHSSWRVLAESS